MDYIFLSVGKVYDDISRYQYFSELKECYNHWYLQGDLNGFEKIEILGESYPSAIIPNMFITAKLRILKKITFQEARELIYQK